MTMSQTIQITNLTLLIISTNTS